MRGYFVYSTRRSNAQTRWQCFVYKNEIKGAVVMLQIILVAVAVLVALSYVFASVAGESADEESAPHNCPERPVDEHHNKTAA